MYTVCPSAGYGLSGRPVLNSPTGMRYPDHSETLPVCRARGHVDIGITRDKKGFSVSAAHWTGDGALWDRQFRSDFDVDILCILYSVNHGPQCRLVPDADCTPIHEFLLGSSAHQKRRRSDSLSRLQERAAISMLAMVSTWLKPALSWTNIDGSVRS
jgi:hypothetical protein